MAEADFALPNIVVDAFDIPTEEKLSITGDWAHPPRILLLYGSLRERSFSRFLIEEAARILQSMGAETRTFNPSHYTHLASSGSKIFSGKANIDAAPLLA